MNELVSRLSSHLLRRTHSTALPSLQRNMDATTFVGLTLAWAALLHRRYARRQKTVFNSEAAFEEKCGQILAGGADKLQFIVDFDRTTTRYLGPNGLKGSSCHGIVERRRSEALLAKAEALNKFYYPIEIDARLSIAEKTPYMEQWYHAVNALLVEAGMSRADLVEDVRDANVQLRPGLRNMLDFAARHDVPVTVFSAGIGDVLREVLLQHYGPLPARLHIVSNWMAWSGPGPDARLVGFSEPLVHMFNKNVKDSNMAAAPWFPSVTSRPHVVLMGDGLGDVTMADGLDAACVLRLGYLNDNVDALLPAFNAVYDAVHLQDSPAWLLCDLLRRMELAAAAEGRSSPVHALSAAVMR